jgi:membrane associated rhomboid family serine protease
VREKEKFIESIIYPILFLLLIWGIKLAENIFNFRLGILGIYPLHLHGLPGIFFSPLIHGDYAHLITNTGPLLVLGTAVFYFYGPLAFRLISLSWIITGIWVWFGGREAYHIGASGLIYALASFLFFSGFIRRSIELMAISLVIVFLYGGMIWGIFPLRENISWESHLMGGIAGFVLAVYYKNFGPQRKKYSWEEEDEDEKEPDIIDDNPDSAFKS